MSVTIAYKSEGVVYCGADTQVSKGNIKKLDYIGEKTKFAVVANDFLLGSVGSVAPTRLFFYHPEWFELDKEIPLTESFIIHNIVNPWTKELIKDVNSDDKYEFNTDAQLILVRQDKIFFINGNGAVYEIDDFMVLGSGKDAAFPVLKDPKEMSPEQRIEKALKASIKYDDGVSNPVILIDTITNELKTVSLL